MGEPSKILATDKHNRDGSWSAWRPSELVEHIIHRFHQPLRRDLPALLARARAVETAYGSHAHCPTGLAELLAQILLSVESHLEKEEKILFPLISAGRGGLAFMPVKVMMAEHEDHLTNLRLLGEVTAGFVSPATAGADWRALYDDLARLSDDLRVHIDIENNILFPRVLGGDTNAT